MGRKEGEGCYLHAKWHFDPCSRLATIDMDRKLVGSTPFWGRGSWVPIERNVAWAETYLPSKRHLDPSSHLATIDMSRKLGVCAPFGEGELGPHLTQCGQDRGLPARQVSSGSIQPFGHNTPTSQTDRTDRQTDRQNKQTTV